MADTLFKIADVKSLKELAHVLTFPLIAVAYFLQSGPSIGWEGHWHWEIPEGIPLKAQYVLFFLYFALKSLWICCIARAVDVMFTELQWKYADLLLFAASLMFLGVGLLGLVAQESHELLLRLNKFWFFASLVWGFACSGRLDRQGVSR